MGRRVMVLVHGSWHGGWCWSRLAPRLAAEGWEVHAPTLTGQGDRSHLLSPQVGLETHIQDVVAHVEAYELDRVVLLGHSYGGMVVRGAQDRLGGRIDTLVYLDAHVPAHGDSMCSLAGAEVASRLGERVRREGHGWILPPSPASVFGTPPGSDQEWIDRRSTPMAWKAYTDALQLRGEPSPAVAQVYLRCERHPRHYFDAAAERHRGQPGWTVAGIDAAHNAMITHPDQVAAALSATVGGPLKP